MAATITDQSVDQNGANIVATFTAAADVTQVIPLPPYTLGSAVSRRSAAQTYTALVEVSQDATNWFTAATVTDASTSSALSAVGVGICRLMRITLSALGGAQTVTVEVGMRR
jgi:hypothetical protein